MKKELETLLVEHESFADQFAEWASDQGMHYQRSWIGNDSISRSQNRSRDDEFDLSVGEGGETEAGEMLTRVSEPGGWVQRPEYPLQSVRPDLDSTSHPNPVSAVTRMIGELESVGGGEGA